MGYIPRSTTQRSGIGTNRAHVWGSKRSASSPLSLSKIKDNTWPNIPKAEQTRVLFIVCMVCCCYTYKYIESIFSWNIFRSWNISNSSQILLTLSHTQLHFEAPGSVGLLGLPNLPDSGQSPRETVWTDMSLSPPLLSNSSPPLPVFRMIPW